MYKLYICILQLELTLIVEAVLPDSMRRFNKIGIEDVKISDSTIAELSKAELKLVCIFTCIFSGETIELDRMKAFALLNLCRKHPNETCD